MPLRVLRQYIRGRSSRRPPVPPVVSSLPCQLSREGYGGVVGLGDSLDPLVRKPLLLSPGSPVRNPTDGHSVLRLSQLCVGASQMQNYRAYFVGPDGHVQNRVDLRCADDAEAIRLAKQLFDGRDMELWQLDRQIRTFKAHVMG